MQTVNMLKLSDSAFPAALANIPTPPQVIYWSGQTPQDWINRPKVSIVGSRKLTGYGKNITERLTGELASAGAVIISGLAYGIDITAHQAALAVDGTTVAVLPSSLDSIYPATHFNIARQITQRGTLISEYPPGSSIAFKSNFIARNRLVSGLADVLLITEAAANSGSMHTARFALEQGKIVMAVPGNITSPTSEGCNNLIKSGALPVTGVNDILFALKISPSKQKPIKRTFTDRHETIVYKLLQKGVSAQEELALGAAISSSELSSALTMLEISGYIRPLGGGHWAIA